MPRLKSRLYIRKQRASECSGFIALQPEITLKSFEVGDLEVLRHEVMDMVLESLRGSPMFGREGVSILTEFWSVPLCSQC